MTSETQALRQQIQLRDEQFAELAQENGLLRGEVDHLTEQLGIADREAAVARQAFGAARHDLSVSDAELAAERSSRQAWAEEALRLEDELVRERKITAAYAEQVRMHHCDGVALSHPADPDKKWTLEELSSVTCYKTGEYSPDVCDGTCFACQPKPLDVDDEDDEAAGGPGFSRPQCEVHTQNGEGT